MEDKDTGLQFLFHFKGLKIKFRGIDMFYSSQFKLRHFVFSFKGGKTR